MDRRSSLVLLAVFGTGVFLAGLELMITAVALPSILASLVDANGSSAWIELRKASWIINGYLLVYILTMPMAGRLADLWGARRLFMGALVVFTIGSALAGAAQTMDQLIAARVVQALGGGVLVPVGTAAAAHLFGGAARPRALGVVGALTFLPAALVALGPAQRTPLAAHGGRIDRFAEWLARPFGRADWFKRGDEPACGMLDFDTAIGRVLVDVGFAVCKDHDLFSMHVPVQRLFQPFRGPLSRGVFPVVGHTANQFAHIAENRLKLAVLLPIASQHAS
jgi:MFS family permease